MRKTLLGFLFKRSKKSSNNSLQKRRVVDPFQRQLNVSQSSPQEKRFPTPALSIKQIEDEMNEELKAFQSYVKEVTETSVKLEELKKMLKSDEISENAYRFIMSELGDHLSISVEEIFKLREALELVRARAKLEWAREKIGLKEFETSEHMMLHGDTYMKREMYSPLHKWEEIISKIDTALSSLKIEEETSIIEQFLFFIKEGLSSEARMEELEEHKALCQKRLSLMSEDWASTRRDKIEEIINLELKASQAKEKIGEVEARFGVGEIDQPTYEYRMSALQGSLKNVEREISDIRKYIDEMDMKMFRCSELIREKP